MNENNINNLSIINILKKSTRKDYLPKCVFVYNSPINKCTGCTSFFLKFGIPSKLPIDSIFDVQNSSSNQKSIDKFVAEWDKGMQKAIYMQTRMLTKQGI